MGLSCVEACSERACETDVLLGSGDQACMYTASWSLVWAAAIRSRAEIIGNTDLSNRDFASGRQAVCEQCWTGVGKELTSSSYCTFRFHVFHERGSNFQGFKSPVGLLWDTWIKDYHNRDCVHKEWRNFSQTLHLYLVYTQIYVQICRTKFIWLHSVIVFIVGVILMPRTPTGVLG